MITLRFAALLLLAGMLAACEGGAGGGAGEEETGSTAATLAERNTIPIAADTIPSPTTSPDLSDANIVAVLDHAHDADSSAGALAATKATNLKVKRFARMMMADHHRLRKQGGDLVRKLGVVPQPRPDDPITPLALQGMDGLEAAARGPDFDRTYIRHEIAAHRTMLELVDQAREAAGNAELGALIERTRPIIESHLKEAQGIEEELGSAA